MMSASVHREPTYCTDTLHDSVRVTTSSGKMCTHSQTMFQLKCRIQTKPIIALWIQSYTSHTLTGHLGTHGAMRLDTAITSLAKRNKKEEEHTFGCELPSVCARERV